MPPSQLQIDRVILKRLKDAQTAIATLTKITDLLKQAIRLSEQKRAEQDKRIEALERTVNGT